MAAGWRRAALLCLLCAATAGSESVVPAPAAHQAAFSRLGGTLSDTLMLTSDSEVSGAALQCTAQVGW
jgi:precorrin-6B methylase 1